MDLDAMHDDVRVDEKILGFVEGLSRKKGRKRYFRNFRNFGGFGLHEGRLLKS